jgi:hypothetical protein
MEKERVWSVPMNVGMLLPMTWVTQTPAVVFTVYVPKYAQYQPGLGAASTFPRVSSLRNANVR